MLENSSPLKLIPKRQIMGNRYLQPTFEHTLELLFGIID
jgi:hypothetical protein